MELKSEMESARGFDPNVVITIRKRPLMRSGSSQQQVPAGLRRSSLLPNSQHY
jgi:hypothetical protein